MSSRKVALDGQKLMVNKQKFDQNLLVSKNKIFPISIKTEELVSEMNRNWQKNDDQVTERKEGGRKERKGQLFFWFWNVLLISTPHM